MGKIILDITMSLDGYIAGPDVTVNNPMGVNGPLLHNWLFADKTDSDAAIIEETVKGSGAVIVGGRTYAIAIDGAWGGRTPFNAPAFIVSDRMSSNIKEGFTLVAGGVRSALARARETAQDKNVWVMGGGTLINQFIKAGIFDELHLHIAPVLLGSGTRLFSKDVDLTRLRLIKSVSTQGAIHTRYTKV